MTDFELGYVIGCFESEGHARADNLSHHSISIAQKDKRMLTYLNILLPRWRLYGPYLHVKTYMYHLKTCDLLEIKRFLDLIRPHLKVKAFQVDDVLAHVNYRLRRRGFPATEPGEELWVGWEGRKILK